MTRVAQEFSRFAAAYSQHNIIQAEVARKLISLLPEKHYRTILDLGCGRGETYRNLKEQGVDFGYLTALDISDEMLQLHPSGENLTLLQGDFNQPDILKVLPTSHYDLLISSSALQWSSDLDVTLPLLAPLSESFYFAIFTAGTFQSLHHCAGVTSPIYSEAILKEKIDKYFDASYETIHYKLHFDTVYKMLRYIKESGTSGGERRIGYAQTKLLLDTYPCDYLEFEVLFAHSKS
ncbi:MAG: methyltransferase domain-containing protein [Campylobacterota bacterium]|nr:methyltransferase domain-containing protein [Campylobacterota bacterium]